MRVQFYSSLHIPGVVHGMISLLGESFFNHSFIDVNFFTISVKHVDINRVVPRSVRTNKENLLWIEIWSNLYNSHDLSLKIQFINSESKSWPNTKFSSESWWNCTKTVRRIYANLAKLAFQASKLIHNSWRIFKTKAKISELEVLEYVLFEDFKLPGLPGKDMGN